jgi:hypothetical protein
MMEETEEQRKRRLQTDAVLALATGAARYYQAFLDREGGEEGWKALTDGAVAYCTWLGYVLPDVKP